MARAVISLNCMLAWNKLMRLSGGGGPWNGAVRLFYRADSARFYTASELYSVKAY